MYDYISENIYLWLCLYIIIYIYMIIYIYDYIYICLYIYAYIYMIIYIYNIHYYNVWFYIWLQWIYIYMIMYMIRLYNYVYVIIYILYFAMTWWCFYCCRVSNLCLQYLQNSEKHGSRQPHRIILDHFNRFNLFSWLSPDHIYIYMELWSVAVDCI